MRHILVLGGIRSGKSEYAERLVADAAAVTYVATAVEYPDDPQWRQRIKAHQERRPPAWATVEIGHDPTVLPTLLRRTDPDHALLIDDLGAWVTALLDAAGWSGPEPALRAAQPLAEAIRSCPGRLVLVSPEVGLSVVPDNRVARVFADALGGVNRAVADACDRVLLVVAGQALTVKGTV